MITNNKIASGNKLLDPQIILSDYLQIGFGEKVADLGCGAMGFFTIQAAKIVGENGVVYAVDVLKEVLSSVEGRARVEGFNNIKTVWTNLESYGATKIPDNSLDAAFLVNILFQTKKHLEIIREAARLLKPGGKLLIIDWKKNNTPFGPIITDRISQVFIKEAAIKLNLILDKEFEAGNFHFGLIFIK